ncbi:hypothetical protein IAU60_000206 [Kwoniella sp. DSM 27419]
MPDRRRGGSPPVDPFPPLRRSNDAAPAAPSYASITARSSHPHRDERQPRGSEGPAGHQWTPGDVDRNHELDDLGFGDLFPIDVDPSPPWRSAHEGTREPARPHRTGGEEPLSSTRGGGPTAATLQPRTDNQPEVGDYITVHNDFVAAIEATRPGQLENRQNDPQSPSPAQLSQPAPPAQRNDNSSRLAPIFTLEQMLNSVSSSINEGATSNRPLVRSVMDDLLAERRRQREAAASGPGPWGMARALPAGADRAAAAMDMAQMDFELLGEPMVIPFSVEPRSGEASGSGSRTVNTGPLRPMDGSARDQAQERANTSFLRRRRRNPAPVPGSTTLYPRGYRFDTSFSETEDESDDARWDSRLTIHNFGDGDVEFDVDGPGLTRSASIHRGTNLRRRRSFLQRIQAPPDLRFPEPEGDITFPPPIRGVADASGHPPTNRSSQGTVAPQVIRSGRRTRDDEAEYKPANSSSTLKKPRYRTASTSAQASNGVPKYSTLSNSSEPLTLPSGFIQPHKRSHLTLKSRAYADHPARPLITFEGYQPTGLDTDATALITTTPIPIAVGVHYYEVHVVNKGVEGFMSVGWMMKGASLRRLVGWDKGSWGWHGDDGRSFEGQGRGEKFSETWTTGDTVGCGVDFTTGRAFFTKNGKMMGHRFSGLRAGLHPAVGLRSIGESVVVNFTGPFQFDIEDYIRSTRDAIYERAVKETEVKEVPRLARQHPSATKPGDTAEGKNEVKQTDSAESAPVASVLGPVEKTTSAFVLDYLRHNGHGKALSMVQESMSKRGWTPGLSQSTQTGESFQTKKAADLRLSDFPSVHAALKYLHDLVSASFDRAIPWRLVLDIIPDPSVWQPAKSVIANLRIFDHVHLWHHSDPSTLDDDSSLDRLIESGKDLRAEARASSWSKGEVESLEEAFALLGSPDDIRHKRWADRRQRWADDLVTVGRMVHGIKPTSDLQEAFDQTLKVMQRLAGNDGRTGAAFIHPSRIVRDIE